MSLKLIEKVRPFTDSAIRKRKWRAENQERYLKNNRERNWMLLGIDVDEANKLRDEATSCNICKMFHNKLSVDHCHRTNKIRGILCPPCNTGLGHFQDEPRFLREAADYLERNQCS